MKTPIAGLTPFIHFGFYKTEAGAASGEEVTVWLSTLFREGAFDISLRAGTGNRVEKISDYEYRAAFDARGEHPVTLIAVSKDKSITVESNTITVTVK